MWNFPDSRIRAISWYESADIESSRDSGWRHELGRLVQFCACRKPTITICRVMLLSRCRPDDMSREVKLGGQFVFAGQRAQFFPCRVFDFDPRNLPLLLPDLFAFPLIQPPC